MKKNLYELTKEDWNTLFPVELTEHKPEWKTVFENEKQRILSKIGNQTILRIEHFGSSSIPKIKAKPYIDIMIEIPEELLFEQSLIDQFQDLGYTYFKVPERDNIKAYMSLAKGYDPNGEKKEQIFHIHMCPKDNAMWNQIDFRDYLIANYERAKQYEDLKTELASKYKHDRGAYVLGKTEFINETLRLIKEAQHPRHFPSPNT
ncbi:GrpB family protein [Sinomicrobium weinanense]|uniref:GrpB family protein n=1 Tax=Sinomicrobium weinanense TaxID=2842200 RepID=A0A926Q362_9FLAO|nr:GrpB family protein [Sinomicrobium weinanense]MBC9795671.1 GrpB family protein [Sinomicrobium weinanense]MBU3122840.1 GrpB family protein [Sinomicrobium weinanense]